MGRGAGGGGACTFAGPIPPRLAHLAKLMNSVQASVLGAVFAGLPYGQGRRCATPNSTRAVSAEGPPARPGSRFKTTDLASKAVAEGHDLVRQALGRHDLAHVERRDGNLGGANEAMLGGAGLWVRHRTRPNQRPPASQQPVYVGSPWAIEGPVSLAARCHMAALGAHEPQRRASSRWSRSVTPRPVAGSRIWPTHRDGTRAHG